MEMTALVGFAAFTAVFAAYTRAFQRATLYWGRALVGATDGASTGLQDAITPPSHTFRNLLSLGLQLAVPIFAIHLHGWLIGVGVFIGMFVLGAISGAAMPQPTAKFFSAAIIRSLADRRKQYVSANDELRTQAIDEVLERLKAELLRMEHAA